MITLLLSAPRGRPIIRSTLPDSTIGPSFGQRIDDSVIGFDRLSSGGKHSMNFVSRSTDWPRRSASSAGERAAIHCADATLLVGQAGHRLVDQIGRVRLAPPRQRQLDRPVRHLALRRGRPPLEVVGDEMELLAVEHRDSLCLEMNTSWFGRRRSVNSSSATSISVRMSATRSGSNTSGSPDRRSASSVLSCAGVRLSVPLAAPSPATSSLTAPTVPTARRPPLVVLVNKCALSRNSDHEFAGGDGARGGVRMPASETAVGSLGAS